MYYYEFDKMAKGECLEIKGSAEGSWVSKVMAAICRYQFIIDK